MPQPADPSDLKNDIRRRASADRRRQQDKDRLSRQICRKLLALPEYVQARTVMLYVGVRGEVRTRPLLRAARRQGKRVVVPYCLEGQLELFSLHGPEELRPGMLQIPEPKVELRALAERKVDVSELDLVVVPGVAFDRQGGRLGHGKGYYDQLLQRVRADTALVALAFECQVGPAIPMQAHDIFMHKVVTEKAVYQRRQS